MLSNQYFEKFDTPDVTRFLRGVVTRLLERRSAIILIPKMRQLVRSNIIDRLKDLFGIQFVQWEDILVQEVKSYDELLKIVLGQLGVPVGRDDELRNLRDFYLQLDAVEENVWYDLLWIGSIATISEESRSLWIRFLQELADYNKTSRYAPNRAVTFCLVEHATVLLPQLETVGDALLAVEWWWDVSSIHDVHVLCRTDRSSLFNPDQDVEQFAKDLWREYVFPTFAAGDIGLVDWLWNRWNFEDSDEAITLGALRSYASQQGWRPEQFSKLPSGKDFAHMMPRLDPPLVRHLPPVWARELWAEGALCWTPEHGLELHTAVLAILKRDNEVWHRFWRGQVGLLMPMIDHMRLLACAHLSMCNPRWWETCRHPTHHKPNYRNQLRKNPYRGELGHISVLIEDGNLQCDPEWKNLIGSLHNLRNRIAHYQPVNFDYFQDFWYRLKELSQRYETGL